jgi:hypothetical protein
MPESSKGISLNELGVSGLQYSSGIVTEEFLTDLQGTSAAKIYREMRDNDPVIGAMMFAVEMMIRQAEWEVKPVEGVTDEQVEFLEGAFDDMSHTWQDALSEILSMLTFGYAPMEVIYKFRRGLSDDSKERSQFDDGKIGWRKFALRSQESVEEWVFDDTGGIQGLIQADPNAFKKITIPIDKFILFRTTSFKNNPEGRSVLRNSYRSWFFKKRIEEIEGIGIERDLAGLPIAWVPPEWLADSPNPTQAASLENIKNIVRNVRRDEMEGIILPSVMHPSTGERVIDFKLLSTGGRRQFNTTEIIQRYDQRIAMTLMADFIILGHDAVGSFALASTKTDMFSSAVNAILDTIADTINRHAVPKLFELNNEEPPFPVFTHTGVEANTLDTISEYVKRLSESGISFTDDETQLFLREQAGMPAVVNEPEDQADALDDGSSTTASPQLVNGGEKEVREGSERRPA